jgi:hypothetical protein
MSGRVRVALMVGLFGIGIVNTSRAETAAGSAHDLARAAFREGNDAYRRGDYEAARGKYLDSLHHERAFDAVCNLGRSEAALKDDGLALAHLDECLKEYPPGDEVAAAREKFFHLREEVRARCKEKKCTVPSEASAGAPTAEEPASSGGKAEPAEKTEPAAAAPVVPETTPAREPSSARLPVSLTLGGLGLVGLGLGVGFAVAADAATADANELRDAIVASGGTCAGSAPDSRCDLFEDRYSSANSSSTISVVGFVAGGSLLAAALATYLLWPEAKEPSASLPKFQFALTDTQAFGSVSGQF